MASDFTDGLVIGAERRGVVHPLAAKAFRRLSAVALAMAGDPTVEADNSRRRRRRREKKSDQPL